MRLASLESGNRSRTAPAHWERQCLKI
jgi:hypothetical protein